MDGLPTLAYFSESVALVNVANFVPTKLHWLSGGVGDSNNYDTCKAQMGYLMESQGLTDYVDGSITLPLRSGQDYAVWKRNDALVKGWIVGSLSDQIASTVVANDRLISANQIWAYLERKFGPPYPISPDNRWRPLQTAIERAEAGIVFLETLLKLLAPEDLLALRNADDNSTALHIAASVGNKAAADLLVWNNPALSSIQNNSGHFPIHVAALCMQREVLEYLIDVTKPSYASSPYSGEEGQSLLMYLIQAEFFDIALRLAQKYPSMLEITYRHGVINSSPLSHLTKKMKIMWTKLGFWERLISSYNVNVPLETTASHANDIEGSITNTTHISSGFCQDFLTMLLRCSIFLVSQKKRSRIMVANQAQQLLTSMCAEIGSLDMDIAGRIIHEVIFAQVELGVQESTEDILKTLPGSTLLHLATPSVQHHLFRKAIEYRSVGVFNLIIDGVSNPRSFFSSYMEENDGNNLLHLAGKLASPHILDRIAMGTAFQMQLEMKWFKAVKEIVHPYSREQKNKDGKTPKMVFTEEHIHLKEAGERWMKGTANSFAFVAALIATVMFTGAITVPGGNQSSTGYPLLSREPAFVVFAISDAASLFASATSLLMFLAILTSSFAEKEFLYSLPRKLIFGLAALSFSVLSMMISFTATLYLVFGQKRQWVLFPLLLFACMPVAAFVLCQFPLLYKSYSLTYGRWKNKQNRS